MLAGTLRELDPAARPVPMLLPGVTDGRFFSRLGIQTYGFLPMQLPAELAFMELIHAPNERLPADALEFGTRAIERVLERFALSRGQAAAACPSSKCTPVSSSHVSHSRDATSSSRAARLGETTCGWPRNSPMPSGPT